MLKKTKSIPKASGAWCFLSAIAVLCCYAYLFYLFHLYDWKHPYVKLFCFSSLFLLVLYLYRKKETSSCNKRQYKGEILVLLMILFSASYINYNAYAQNLLRPPIVDHGQDSVEAANIFLWQQQNPYQAPISRLGRNPSFWGYKHGPVLFFGYALSTLIPTVGFKITTIVYLALTILVLIMLSLEYLPHKLSVANWATALFVSTIFILPTRLWYELFHLGAADIFPTLLLLLSLLFIAKKYWLWAGFLAGLAFAAKFAPAIFLIILFCRRRTKLSFWLGAAVGALPVLAFFLWDWQSLINNMFIFHSIKAYDSTSLYWVTPTRYHGFFPLIQITAVLFFLWLNYHKEIHYRDITVHLLLLFIIIEATFKEVHANHLIVIAALLSVVLTWYRYRLLPLPAILLKTHK